MVLGIFSSLFGMTKCEYRYEPKMLGFITKKITIAVDFTKLKPN